MVRRCHVQRRSLLVEWFFTGRKAGRDKGDGKRDGYDIDKGDGKRDGYDIDKMDVTDKSPE